MKKIKYVRNKFVGNFDIVKQEGYIVWVKCKLCNSNEVEKHNLCNLLNGHPNKCKRCKEEDKKIIEYEGEKYNVKEFCKKFKIPYSRVLKYLKNTITFANMIDPPPPQRRKPELIYLSSQVTKSNDFKNLKLNNGFSKLQLAKAIGISKQAIGQRIKMYPNDQLKWIQPKQV